MLQWAALGAIMLAALVFCARIMKRGLTTLDDDRKQCIEKIRLRERQLAEDRKNIPAADHMLLVRAAVEDLMRLEGRPEGFSITDHGNACELHCPTGDWRIELAMRELNLRSTKKVVHGRCLWLLSGKDCHETHADPASLMRSLNQHLHESMAVPGEPEHLARRLAHATVHPRRQGKASQASRA